MPLGLRSPDWSSHSAPPCSPPRPRSSRSSRSSLPCLCSWSWSDSQSLCMVLRWSSSASRCNWLPHSTHSNSIPPARSPPSLSDSSAPVVSPAGASHLPGWSSHSVPPCSPLPPRSSTSSRSSLPCPCNLSSLDFQSSCMVPRSSSTASRCSLLPHSTHSNSIPPAHSRVLPPDSSVLAVSPPVVSHLLGWNSHSVPPCSPPTLRSSTSSRSSLLCLCNCSSSDSQSSCTVPRSSSTAARCSWLPHSTHSNSTLPARSPASLPSSLAPVEDSCSTLYCRSNSERLESPYPLPSLP